jgi:hypothetical protein
VVDSLNVEKILREGLKYEPVAHDDGRLAAREKRARAEIGDLTCSLSNVIGDILLFEMRIVLGKDHFG